MAAPPGCMTLVMEKDVPTASTQPSLTTEGTSENRKIRKHTKARTGCTQCKSRRIKCDEGRPSCRRCIIAGKVCDYSSVPKTIIFDPNFTTEQAQSFHYFLQRTSHWISTYHISSKLFWTELVPQMTHAHPAIKQVSTALASFQAGISSPGPASQDLIRDLDSFSSAIRSMSRKRLDNLAPEVLLTALLLFCVHETFFNQSGAIAAHLATGWKIFHKCICTRSQSRSLSILTPMMNRLFVDSAAFRDNFPSAYFEISDECLLAFDLHVPPFFRTIYEAYESLDGFIKCIVRSTMKPITPSKLSTLQTAQTLLPQFLTALVAMQDLPENRQLCHEPNFWNGIQCLQVHYRAASIMASTMLSSDQSVYDAHESDFEFIVSSSAALLEPLISQDMFEVHLGFIPPLFMAATACRNPHIRRWAVEILHESKRRERTWKSCMAARVAEKIIEIEEDGLSCLSTSDNKSSNGNQYPPVSSRIKLVSAIDSPADCCTVLRYTRPQWKRRQSHSNTSTTMSSSPSFSTASSPFISPDEDHNDECDDNDDDEDLTIYEDRSIRWGPEYRFAELVPPNTQLKVFRAFGYAGNLLTCRKIECQCPTGLRRIWEGDL